MPGARAQALQRLSQASRRGDVVVFHEDRIVETEAMIDAAAAAYGILSRRREGRVSSCACQRFSRRCNSRRSTYAAVAVAIPERWHEKIEGDPLAGKEPRALPSIRASGVTGCNPVAVADERREPDRRIDLAKLASAIGSPAMTPGLRAAISPRRARIGGDRWRPTVISPVAVKILGKRRRARASTTTARGRTGMSAVAIHSAGATRRRRFQAGIDHRQGVVYVPATPRRESGSWRKSVR